MCWVNEHPDLIPEEEYEEYQKIHQFEHDRHNAYRKQSIDIFYDMIQKFNEDVKKKYEDKEQDLNQEIIE
jgi:hypothetical protein